MLCHGHRCAHLQLFIFENPCHVAHEEDPVRTLLEVRTFLNDGDDE